MNTNLRRLNQERGQKAKVKIEFAGRFKKLAFICTHLWLVFLFSCQSKPTDLRSLAPAETIIYLETKDLGETLASLTESRAFAELAREKTDFSALEDVQFAVAVAGFEISEQVDGEQAALSFKPHFVAIADTHRWNWTAASIAENQAGALARKLFGENVKLERSEKDGAKFFVWTDSAGKRKIFAAASDGVIYVATDEGLIDKCLAVKRGAAENLLKNENLARARAARAGDENEIAFGYASSEGIAQIADVVGVSAAVGATENDGARNFIARILPQILQKTAREISWTAKRGEQGIEDDIFVATSAEIAPIFKEVMQTGAPVPTNSAEFLPSDVFSATRYNLKNPQIAWRGLLLTVGRQTDAATGRFLAQFSNGLLSAYGVADADAFLSSVDSEIYTAELDEAGEEIVAVVAVKDSDALKKSLAEIDFKSKPEKLENAEIWKSESGDAAAFVENKLILGERESVLKCLQAKTSGRNFTKNRYFQKFNQSKSAAVTFARDADSTRKIVEVLGAAKDENREINFISLTETAFTEKGIERRTVSAFGLIGMILERLEE